MNKDHGDTNTTKKPLRLQKKPILQIHIGDTSVY